MNTSRKPGARRIETGLETGAFGDRELLDEKAGAQQQCQGEQHERRQTRAPSLEQRKAGDGRDSRFHATIPSQTAVGLADGTTVKGKPPADFGWRHR